MRINEFAKLTGVSARALRHYEDRGLLHPARTSSGYRDYSEADITRVSQIRAMISAGLGTSAIERYLDCARGGDDDISLEMCPSLRVELDSIADRLNAKLAGIRATQQRLSELAPTC